MQQHLMSEAAEKEQRQTSPKNEPSPQKPSQPTLQTALNVTEAASDGNLTLTRPDQLSISKRITISRVTTDKTVEEEDKNVEKSPTTPKAPASSGNINDEQIYDGYDEDPFFLSLPARPSTQGDTSTVQTHHSLPQENQKKTQTNKLINPSTSAPGFGQQEQPASSAFARLPKLATHEISRQKGGPPSSNYQHSVTNSSYPAMTNLNLNAISNGNISINTSTNKLTFDEEDNLHFSDEDEGVTDDAPNDEDSVDNCFNQRFVKHNDCISKRKLRTIHRGYDNESGCEIAWTTYTLHNYKREMLLKALDQVKEIHHQNILRVFYYEIRPVPTSTAPSGHKQLHKLQSIKSQHSLDSVAFQSNLGHQPKELIVVSELITAGSIREYLKKIKTLRLNVIKRWCTKVLEALEFLHERDIVHGELSCETIYINSNNGEIKVGDVGIKHIHTLSKSHELGSCKRYRDEKGKPSVDVFCFGLTLLEIVAASDISPGRFTLKYIIRIMNEDKKDELLEKLTYEPLRDFVKVALEDDPETRLDVKQLLRHPFLTSATENRGLTQLSSGMKELIEEQIAYFKQQRALHQQSKISNSLQHSMLNDSVHKKYLSSKKQSVALTKPSLTTSNQRSQIKDGKGEGQLSNVKQPSTKNFEKSSSIDVPRLSSHGLTTTVASNSVLNLALKPCGLKPGSPPGQNPLLAPSQVKILETAPKATSCTSVSIKEASFKKDQVTARQRKLTKGKTTSLLELPNSVLQKRKKKQMYLKPFGLSQMRESGSKGFASATYPSASRRKFSVGSSAQAHLTKLDPDGESQRTSEETKYQPQRTETGTFGGGQQVDNNDGQQLSQRLPVIEVENEIDGQHHQEQASPTNTQMTESVIHFRIQIMMKGRKYDVKFPFDITKDTPEVVANELQDYFKQQGGLVLPMRAVEAIVQEIQRGLDSHNQFQQTTITDGSQAQTQHSYTHTVVISKMQERTSPSSATALVAPPTQPATVQKQQVSEAALPKEESDKEEEKSAENEEEKQNKMELRAKKLEQEEVAQKLAHDYLSKLALEDSQQSSGSRYDNVSPPELVSSNNDSRDIHEGGLMQAEIMQKLHAGQITIDEFEIRYQQARRKVSISHNSNHRNNDHDQFNFEGNQALKATTKQPSSSIDDVHHENSANSAAKIEIEPHQHNNTTGERHGQMIKEHQMNGPYGQQDILAYRNSIEYNDPNLVNFMLNPDEDKQSKDRRQGQYVQSVKSEEQEDLWLLREMFPDYAQIYHENYVNNNLNGAAHSNLQQSSAADTHTSIYSTELSFHSQEGSHHFLDTQRHQDLQSNEPPFQSDLSIIQLPQEQPNQTQTSGRIALVQPQSGLLEGTSVKPVSMNQPNGDSSSQQCQLHSDCDEAQVNKNFAQQSTNVKNAVTPTVPVNHQSFLQDISESIIKDLVRKDATQGTQSSVTKQSQLKFKNGAKLNNSHNYFYGRKIAPAGANQPNNTILLQTQPSTASGNRRECYSFLSNHFDAKNRMAMQSQNNNLESNHHYTGTITEMPDTKHPLSSGSGTQDTKTSKQNAMGSNKVQDACKSTFEVQLGSQISDSQNNSNGLTHRNQRSGKVQHAITYSRDQGQIKVISSSTEHSSATANQLLQVQQHNKEDDPLHEIISGAPADPQLSNLDHVVLHTTPSVVDIKKSPEIPTEEMQSPLLCHNSLVQRSSLKTQKSIKGFPNIMINQNQNESATNTTSLTQNQQSLMTVLTHEYPTQTQSSSYDTLTESSVTASDSQISPKRMRFSTQQKSIVAWRDSGDKLTGQSVSSMSTASQDLQRLQQIKKRGLKSELLVKGGNMLKRDINNCKFMLNLTVQQGGLDNPGAISKGEGAKSDKLLMEDGHFDRHTRSLLKRFKKREGITGDPNQMKVVDKHTWDTLFDCAFLYARAQVNVNRITLEAVQEQEEDQKFEETQRSQTSLEADNFDEEEESKVRQQSCSSGLNSRAYNEEQSISSLERGQDEQSEVRGRFRTVIEGQEDLEASIEQTSLDEAADTVPKEGRFFYTTPQKSSFQDYLEKS